MILDNLIFHHSSSARGYIGSGLILIGVLVTLWASHAAAVVENEVAAEYLPEKGIMGQGGAAT